MNQITKILIYVIILIVFTTLGFFTGKISNNAQLAEYEALKQNINKAFPQPAKEIYSFDGVVKDISGSQITIELSLPPEENYPWSEPIDPQREERVVNVSKNTVLKKIMLDPLAEPEFNEDGSLKEPEETAFQLSELKQGDYIQVTSIENVRTNKQITAKEITIQEVKQYTPDELGLPEPGLGELRQEDLNTEELP